MPKEWILNSVMNRFQLNFKRNVGAVSEEIRKCSPKILEDWEKYYFENVYDKEHIESLGRRLYVKITEVISAEVRDITEEDCIKYMFDMVINRTFDGYETERTTIYGQLEQKLGIKIEPSPDEWDRLFNVDFFIKVSDKYIGLQVKPVNDVSHIEQIFKERSFQKKSHEKFKKKYGGEVFYIFSIKSGDQKIIQNPEVIDQIKNEIKRLENE